jgi:SNF2 family DNA or RNA helicase
MNLHEYQKQAIDMILNNRYCGLFLDMGMGKTLSVLKSLQILKMFDGLEKTLIIAPLRVAKMTWPNEIEKWGFDFTYSLVMGDKKERLQALKKEAEIYITNIDNLVWISEYWDFVNVVIDEASAFKNIRTNRFKTIKRLKYKRLIALTGTPAPNGLIELWPLVYLLDHGVRLGRTLSQYRNKFFTPGARNGQVVFKYEPIEGAKEKVYKAISDICISMENIKKPEFIINDIIINLSPEAQQVYTDMENELFLDFEEDNVTAINAPTVINKLRQIANGFVYTDEGAVINIHDEKYKALKDIIEQSNGNNVLVFFQYNADVRGLLQFFDKAIVLNTDKDFAAWNRGEIELALINPASCGHGLNLQDGGHIIVWFSLSYSLEMYLQANARLVRQGQQNTVIINRIIAQNTVDEIIVRALENKEATLKDLLLNLLREYRK